MVTGQGAEDAGIGFQPGLGAGHHGAADARPEGTSTTAPIDRVRPAPQRCGSCRPRTRRPAAPTRRAALRRPPGPDAELGGINVARHVLRRGPHRTLPPRGAPHAPLAAADRPQLCGPSARPAPGRPGPAPPPPETTPARRCVSRWYAARDLSSSSSPAGPLPAMAATRRTAAACTSRTTIRTLPMSWGKRPPCSQAPIVESGWPGAAPEHAPDQHAGCQRGLSRPGLRRLPRRARCDH